MRGEEGNGEGGVQAGDDNVFVIVPASLRVCGYDEGGGGSIGASSFHPFMLLVLVASKTGRCETHRRPVSACLTPPTLGGYPSCDVEIGVV